MSARVADFMTANPVAVRGNASFKEIAARLRELRVSAFPVIDADDKVIGVVSEADLLPKEALEAGHEGHPGWLARLMRRAERDKAVSLTAYGLMSRPPITVGPFDLVSHAAHLMYDHKITCLPVVDQGRLVGKITRADVLSVFGRPDANIRQEILQKVIRGEFLADPVMFRVTVNDGVVTLEGSPESAEMGHGIVAAVRHMEGVVGVHDYFTYPSAGFPPARLPSRGHRARS